MEIKINNPDGTTLLTEKKYCTENIDVIPELQEKTAIPAGAEQTITPDDGYAGLSSVKVKAVGDGRISDIDLSYGEQTLTYDTTDGITLGGAGKVTYTDGSIDDITKEIEIPIIAANGLSADVSSDGTKVEIKVDSAKSVYMATTPTATNAVPVKIGNSWIGIAATPSAAASSVVTRDANGRAQFGTPVNDADAATKSFVEDNLPTVGTLSGTQPTLKSITFCTDADIPAEPSANIEYSLTDLIAYADLDSNLQSKIDNTATKEDIDAVGPASSILTLSSPDTAVNGTLTADEFAVLQASENASIMFNHKKYDLGAEGHQEGYWTYTHAGYENNVHILESITITISTRAWVLNTTEVLDTEEIKEQVVNPAIPTWKTTVPTTEVDKKKVQFTKVIISTTDDTNFPGMNGRYAIVPGFTNDGFHYGTVVCSQADPAYEYPFIGSITSEMASGTIIKPSVAPTYISVVDPAVTFSYEYLW